MDTQKPTTQNQKWQGQNDQSKNAQQGQNAPLDKDLKTQQDVGKKAQQSTDKGRLFKNQQGQHQQGDNPLVDSEERNQKGRDIPNL